MDRIDDLSSGRSVVATASPRADQRAARSFKPYSPLDSLPILDVGSCEPLKAAVHTAALGLCALMGLYNAAAWLKRRQTHLAVNAVIYLAATYWEQRHVSHHIVRCVPAEKPVQAEVHPPEPLKSAAA